MLFRQILIIEVLYFRTAFFAYAIIKNKVDYNQMIRENFGDPVDVSDYPFMVQYVDRPPGVVNTCGAVLTGPTTVIVAAHCVKTLITNYMQIQRLTNDGSVFAKRHVKKAILPGKYDDITLSNDVAMIIIDNEFKPNEAIPAEVSLRKLTSRDKVTTLGWGRTSPLEERSHKLRRFTSPVLPWSKCLEDNLEITQNAFCVPASMLSAGIENTGGPALVKGKVVGISSQLSFSEDRDEYFIYYTAFNGEYVKKFLIDNSDDIVED